MKPVLPFVLTLSLLTAGTAFAAGAADKDQNANALTDDVIHSYLIRHPEVLLEMSQLLRDKEQAASDAQAKSAIAENRAAIFHDPRDPVVGNPNGDVSVVIFQDKECPYCKAVAPELAKLIAADKGVRIVFKEFPILGNGSTIAAHAVLAAVKQGKFEALNAKLLADKTPEHQLTEGHIFEIAKSVGLDVDRLKSDMAAPELDSLIADNKLLAAKIGISGTPGILVGDQLAPGAVPFEDLTAMVATARADAKTASGTHTGSR